MVTVLLASLDLTIVTTALPVIVGDIGGLSSYVWVFSAFLLCSTVTLPIYGRLGDIFGRRRMLFVAIPMFLAGSMLCGLAQTMTELIVFRGVQGLGAGGVFSLAIQTSGAIVPPRSRGRYVALHSAAYAVGAILGPTLGGLIVESGSWRWIFFLNVPVGLVALLVIALTLPRGTKDRTVRVDIVGAGLIAIATTSLLLSVLGPGRPYVLISCLVFGLLVVLRTRRVAEPIVPIHVVTSPIVAIAAFATAAVVACDLGTTAFVPLFAQGVLGVSALSSGIVVIPKMLGAVAAVTLAGQWISHTGHYRRVAVAAPLVVGLAMLLLTTAGTETATGKLSAFMAVVGIGGGMLVAVMLAAQNAVPVSSIGAATSLVQFSREIGTTVGVTVFGAIVHQGLPRDIAGQAAVVSRLPDAERSALAEAFQSAFLLGAGVCLVVLVVVWLRLEERPLRTSLEEPPMRPLASASSPDGPR